MTPTERVIAFRPDEDTLKAMEELQDRDGVSLSEQIRRALRDWLRKKGLKTEILPITSARRRVRAQRRTDESRRAE